MEKTDLVIVLKVKDKETGAFVTPDTEIPINARLENVTGVINHVAYIIPKLLDTDKSQMIGSVKDDDAEPS